MSYTSVANGLMESILERFMEISRPEVEKSLNFINKLETRAFRSINWLENNLKNFNDNIFTMDKIAIACALEYTVFRFTDKWQKNNKNLSIWLENFQKNDFMKLTIPDLTLTPKPKHS